MPADAASQSSTQSPSSADRAIRRPDSPYDVRGYPLGHAGLSRDDSEEPGAERKRKRNKPTLSCAECVDRKTKEARHLVADEYDRDAVSSQARRMSGPVKSKKQNSLPYLPPKSDPASFQPAETSSNVSNVSSPISALGKPARSNQTLLSNIPYSVPSASNIYGIGSEHPFKHYWTLSGGLGEVVSVLPSKDQADILVAKFFDAVDPIYPLLHKAHFCAKYSTYWRLSHAERVSQVDSSFLALLLVMLAMGTQFLRLPGDPVTTAQNQTSGAEFYASACHQALRIGAYLNRTSVPTLQAMVLMTYFLMNANHASDGWAFAGVIIRQAYAMGLNRDPSLLFDPGLTSFEKAERRRLWHGVVCQDAFMSMILRLPPGAMHADIDRALPLMDGVAPTTTSPSTSHSSPPSAAMSPGGRPESTFDDPNDVGYVNGMYSLALLVQETISSPRSLSLPMASTPRHRTQLLGRFRACYRSFPDSFRAWDDQSIYELQQRPDLGGPRLVRQILFLTSNYWHSVMLIYIEGCEMAESTTSPPSSVPIPSFGPEQSPVGPSIPMNVKGALEAGHEAIRAFFVLHTLLEGEAGTWWVMAHRAFTEALAMADLLKKHPAPEALAAVGKGHRSGSLDPINSHWRPPQPQRSGSEDVTASLFMKARIDVVRMIDVLKSVSAQDEISRTRVEVLEDICRRIPEFAH